MVALFKKGKYVDSIFLIFDSWDKAAEWGMENIDEDNFGLFTISKISKLRAVWHKYFYCT